MKTWLHWIGNEYYSIESFISEAEEYGVSRRVPKHILKKMEWGDKVFLATRETGKKKPVIFGYFYIDRLQGINIDDLPEDIAVKVVNAGPVALVKRGCGYLVAGGIYAYTDANVERLADYAGEETFVRGGFKIFPEPYPELSNLSFPSEDLGNSMNKSSWNDLHRAKLVANLSATKGHRPKLDDFYYV